MKITIVGGFFLPVPPARGGATEKSWYRLAKSFAAAGHEVTYISRSWPGFPNQEIESGIRHLRVRGFNHTRRLGINLILDFLWSLRVTIAVPSGDILVSHCVSLPVWIRLLRPRTGRTVSVMARMPKGQTRLYGKVDWLFALTTAVAAEIARENPALSGRVSVVPFPIDWPLLAASSRQVEKPSILTIGYIGRINEEKGLDLLLKAASRLSDQGGLPPWKLTIRGPLDIAAGGSGEAWLNNLISQCTPALRARLEVLPPEFSPSKLAAHYGEIDVFVYPSLAERGETFGVAVAEAMAAGCVPVVSQLDCFADLVADGRTGFVFDHRAPDAVERLAGILSRLLNDAALRRSAAEAGTAFVRKFDFAEMERKVLSEFAHLLGRKQA